MPRHGIIADEIIAADEVVKSGVSSALSDVKLRDGVTFWNINRAALSIWWALRTSPCRGPNPSVDRRVRWMRRAPGWQGAPDGPTHERIVLTG